MRKHLVDLLGLGGLCLLASCGGGYGTSTPPVSRPTITSAAPPAGTVGMPYGNPGFAPSASGGVQPYHWSWAGAPGSSLPPGLTLNDLGISGQPTTAGTYNVVITVADSQSPPQQASANYPITIAQTAQLAITSGNPPRGIAGSYYGEAVCGGPPVFGPCYFGFYLQAAGGVQPYRWTWTAASGSSTPPGLSIVNNGACPANAKFSGRWKIICKPTTAGTYNVVVTLTDSASPANQVSTNYTIKIVNPPPPSIATFPPPQGAAINLPYTFRFTGNGGLKPLTWTETGALPPGLVLSNPDIFGGVLSGTPIGTGTFPITVMITDAAGQTSAPANFTIVSAAHGFKVTGNMTASRIYHAATLLQDGRVLVSGGEYGGTVLSSTELYDPAARTFSAAANMTTPRDCHSATSLNDGRVLIAGGFDGNGAVLATAEIFDPAKGTFVATGTMAAPRACQTATLLKNGTVLLVGGSDINGAGQATAELFDPAKGTFSPIAAPMASARVYHSATLLPDGRVLIAGGVAQGVNGLTSAELFDPATGLFSPTSGVMASARLGHTATLLSTGKVLLAGGSVTVGVGSALSTAEIFDPATEAFVKTGSMGMPHTFHTATALNDGTVLVAGGDPQDILTVGGTSYGWTPTPLASAELFDPVAGGFTETGGLVKARENYTATRLNDGSVLVTGGFWYSPTPETYQ